MLACAGRRINKVYVKIYSSTARKHMQTHYVHYVPKISLGPVGSWQIVILHSLLEYHAFLCFVLCVCVKRRCLAVSVCSLDLILPIAQG